MRDRIEVGLLALLFSFTLSYGANRSVPASKIEQAPVLDGRVEEQEWKKATVTTHFVQQRPALGNPATEKTEVRFLYTQDALYIGVICFDSEPEKIVDTQSHRDGDLTDSDSILIILDTYHDGRNGFLFGTNPAGIQYDAQILNEGISGGLASSSGIGRSVTATTQRGNVAAVNLNWDTTWTVKSSLTERGWETEIEIPLKSLRFRDSKEPQVWGLNVMRNIRRKNEQTFWAEIPQAYSIYRVSMAGDLESLEVQSPRNFKLIPYVLAGPQKDFSVSGTDFKNEVGFDVKYGLASTLTLDLTVNTDFAQVEVDDEQINLTRFDLFFPEKRPFFLENAGTFAFGTPQEMDLFFSRRIGIEDGREVPIRAGVRMTGKVDRFNLGVLSIQTGEEDFVAAQNFFVGRVRREFHRRSSVGFIFTNRENVGDLLGHSEYNRAWGADLQLGLGEHWVVSSYLAKTYTPELSGDDYTGNFFAEYRSDLWRIEARYLEIQDNFNPELGFVQRKGFRRPRFGIYFTPSPESGPVRQWNPHFTVRRFYGFDGKLETEVRHHDLEIQLRNGGSIGIAFNRDFEFLRVPFEVHPGVSVPAGTYQANRWNLFLASDPSASIFGDMDLTFAGFFGGDIKSYDFSLGFRRGAEFVTTLSYVDTVVDAPWGHFNTNLGRLRINYSFTPFRFIQAFLQYNSRLHEFSSNIRLGLTNSSGTGLYVVYNESYDTPGETFDPLERAFFVKYSYQFDF
ncbi:carbohydrate binding family 9 domain-containing protein [Acidobacteria bacterium AH-259-D05]|nr:carbohydrate binding family 9 domain-containing protein [Acidobacteria bacterium AH-259-D05]